MYKSCSFFGKLVSLVLMVIAMVIIKNYNIFLLLCGMIFIVSFINREKKYFFLSLLLFLVTFWVNYNDITFLILRVVLVIIYALIIESSLLSIEKRYLYDKLFYRSNSNNKLKSYVKKYYYKDLVNKNIEDNQKIIKYLDQPEKYNKYLTMQAEKKADALIEDMYLIDRIRFDRFYSHKKSHLAFSWNNYDNFYMFISLILFIIVLVLGR